jgi:hypothetical protein
MPDGMPDKLRAAGGTLVQVIYLEVRCRDTALIRPAKRDAESGLTRPHTTTTFGKMNSALTKFGIFNRVILMCIAPAALGQMALTEQGKAEQSIQGKLVVEAGKPARLENGAKATPLTSDTDSIAETLQDTRLSGRELKLVGKMKGDGSFEVHDFFIVRGDALFRLIYFCDTCNITTFRPGICLCCQQPTVPMEVPLTDHRVYQEEIKPRAKKP